MPIKVQDPGPVRNRRRMHELRRSLAEGVEEAIKGKAFGRWFRFDDEFPNRSAAARVAIEIRAQRPWVPKPPKGRRYETATRSKDGRFYVFVMIVKDN